MRPGNLFFAALEHFSVIKKFGQKLSIKASKGPNCFSAYVILNNEAQDEK